MNRNFSVLIPDGESPFAFHVLTCLAQSGRFDIHLLSRRPDAMTKYSRAKKSFHVISAGQDYLEYIKEFCSRIHVDLILPVDWSAILYFAERQQPTKEIAGLCLMDNSQNLRSVSDKGSLANFLHKNNLPHPLSITNLKEFNEIIHEFPMPVLVKPRIAGDGEGISRYEKRGDVLQLVEDHPSFFDEYLIQEYMDGHDIDCSVLCRGGVILAHTIQKTLYAHAELYKPAEGIEFVHDVEVFEIAARLMESLRWTGIAHVDMRRRASNSRVEIIEINPRFWGSVQGSLLAGVNFPQLVCQASKEQTFPMPNYHDSKYMSGFSILKRIMRNQPVTRLLGETNLWMMMRDPLPNLMKLIGRVK